MTIVITQARWPSVTRYQLGCIFSGEILLYFEGEGVSGCDDRW